MNIAYARLGSPIEINVEEGSIATLATEIRQGLLHDWTEDCKFDVSLVTELKERDIGLVQNKSFWGNKWYNKLVYSPLKIPDGTDVLFVECGATNMIYEGKIGNFVEPIFKLMKEHEGKIIYYQHGHLPFPFPRLKNLGNRDDKSDLDMGKVFKKYFSSLDELLQKDITVLHHFQNEQVMIKEFGYDDYKEKLKFKFIPIGYSETDKHYIPKSNPEWELVWIGGENDSNKGSGTKDNTREPMLQRYFQDTSYNSVVIGKWSDEVRRRLKGVNFLGALGKHGTAYNFFNNAYCTFWGGSNSTKRTGLLPTRPVMALLAGSIIITEKDMKASKYISDEYAISSQKEIEEIIEKVKKMTIEERKAVCDKQLSNFPKWKDIDWGNIFEN